MITQMKVLRTLPLGLSASSSATHHRTPSVLFFLRLNRTPRHSSGHSHGFLSRPSKTFKLSSVSVALAAGDDAVTTSSSAPTQTEEVSDPKLLEYVQEIKRVLELLRKNRDMLFSEVKLTIMIEDPREEERRRLLGIEDQDDAPTRDDLAAALEEVNEGKIPQNHVALRMLAEEMSAWPNLEVEVEKKKKKPEKSLYARATDTGVDPKEAAKRLNIDWDTAAEIDDGASKDDTEVPALLGYGALYLVTAFPIIIGISVVLILFYNSLQ